MCISGKITDLKLLQKIFGNVTIKEIIEINKLNKRINRVKTLHKLLTEI